MKWNRLPQGKVVQVLGPDFKGQLQEAYGDGIYAVIKIDRDKPPELGDRMVVVGATP